jgi:hypothetical protein
MGKWPKISCALCRTNWFVHWYNVIICFSNLIPVTQLYVSVDASTKDSLKKIDRPLFRDFWERLLASLEALSKKASTDFMLVIISLSRRKVTLNKFVRINLCCQHWSMLSEIIYVVIVCTRTFSSINSTFVWRMFCVILLKCCWRLVEIIRICATFLH